MFIFPKDIRVTSLEVCCFVFFLQTSEEKSCYIFQTTVKYQQLRFEPFWRQKEQGKEGIHTCDFPQTRIYRLDMKQEGWFS